MSDIYKPIYMVGQPHAGLTLIVNILDLDDKIFRVTNHKFYKDEGHNILFDKLPQPLRNPGGKGGSCWRYGWKVDGHRSMEEHVTDDHRRIYTKVLEEMYRNHSGEGMRLLDKSQPYLVKTRYVQEIVRPAESYFIYVVRNPYSLCYQPVAHSAWYPNYGANKRNADINYTNMRERLRLGCKHNINTHRCFMEDKEHLDRYIIVRYEDVMLDHRNFLIDLFNFLDLEFKEDYTERKATHGGYRKFYPLQRKYLNQHRELANDEFDAIVKEHCGEIIEEFKYPKEFNLL